MVAAGIIAALVVGGGAVSSLAASPAHADEDPYKTAQDLKAQRESLESDMEGTSADLAAAFLALNDTKLKVADAQIALDQANKTLDEAQRKDKELADRLDTAQTEEATVTNEINADQTKADQTRSSIANMARQAYRNGGVSNQGLSVALGAKTPEEFLQQTQATDTATRIQNDALSQLQQSSGLNRNRQARLGAIQTEIAGLKDESAANVKVADQARKDAATNKASIDALKTQQETQAAAVQAKLSQQQATLDQTKADEDAVAAQIAKIEADKKAKEEADRAAAAAAGKPAPPAGGGSAVLNPGGLAMPVPAPYVVTSPYGWRVYPINGAWTLHPGTDLRAACGVPIYAAASGTVTQAKMNGSHGNQVILDNGYIQGVSVVTVYNHFSAFNVVKGQTVNQGDVIGYAGQTGLVTACHLHFEVFTNGTRIDPQTVLPKF